MMDEFSIRQSDRDVAQWHSRQRKNRPRDVGKAQDLCPDKFGPGD